MPRDRIAELTLIKQRAGKYKRIPSSYDIERLKVVWETQLKTIEGSDELIPIRIVTMLEVFLRHWIESLIDHGAPYLERASTLKVDLRYDFAIASSLQGGSVTIGQLLAHSVQLNRVENFAVIFDTLLNEDLFTAISKTRNPWKIRHEGEGVEPIIKDIARLRKNLVRLFEVRHILVHELPESKPYKVAEVSGFLEVATQFIEASEEELLRRISGGDYPLSQMEMNINARDKYQVAEEELDKLCKMIAVESPVIDDVQKDWKAFMRAEAKRQAQMHLGGSIRPMLYSIVAEDITRSRINELTNWLENRRD